MRMLICLVCWLFLGLKSCFSSTDTLRVFCNQVGFFPESEKLAVVSGKAAVRFTVYDLATRIKILDGASGEPRQNLVSGKWLTPVDFSRLQRAGQYLLIVEGAAQRDSVLFRIEDAIYADLGKAALKSYYFQRASIALPVQYAGVWTRPAAHPDTQVLVHSSAASSKRPVNSVISAPRGWYDAGDYNKYVVNSGISTATLLSAFEDFPGYSSGVVVDLPESGNGLPDLLNEVLWNLRWMLSMQDPDDGGVYHKLTNARFDGVVMPHQATTPRYVVQKSTAAALNLAAVAAQSARIFRHFDTSLPGLADSCLTAAEAAWRWAEQNPEHYYRQDQNNETFEPAIATGTYGDRNLSDERVWAATELWLTSEDDRYKASIVLPEPGKLPAASWNQVLPMAAYSIARLRKAEASCPLFRQAASCIVAAADSLVSRSHQNPYGSAMGASGADFMWGSNGHAANQGALLLQAYQLTRGRQYYHAAMNNLHYLLGRNATGYCFVTGFGEKRVMHPHHRPSEADTVRDPVPGLLAGGPNRGRQDKCTTYPNNLDDEAFTDDYCSYASNEIAINWNAPLVYLVWGLNASR